MKSETDVIIRERPDGLRSQEATVFEPDVASPSAAIVVLLHGAGSIRLRDWYTLISQTIAQMGVVVVNADWMASVTHPIDGVSDAVCAVAFAEELSRSSGVSQPRVIIVGHSGGSYTGLLASLAPESFSDGCDTAPQSPVWAHVGLAGDPAGGAEGGNVHDIWKNDPELLATMDTYTHLGGNPDLIVRFIHGTSDELVPLERTKAFHDAMVEAGYDSEFIAIDGARHLDPAMVTHPAGIASLDAIRQLIAMSES